MMSKSTEAVTQRCCEKFQIFSEESTFDRVLVANCKIVALLKWHSNADDLLENFQTLWISYSANLLRTITFED